MSVRHDDKWLGRTLLYPSTWLILGAGIYLHCWLNYTRWQNAGVGEGMATVDEVTPTSQVFYESMIGSAIAVALVVCLAMLRGEKFEWTSPNEGFGGKTWLCAKVMAAAIVIGFVFMVSVNLIDPINKSKHESIIAARRAERAVRMQAERQAAVMAQEQMRRQEMTRVDDWQRHGSKSPVAIGRMVIKTTRSYMPSRPAPQSLTSSYEAQMARIRRQLATGNNLQ